MVTRRELTTSLPWLHGKLKLDNEINLYYLLCDIRAGEWKKYYTVWQKNGRTIHEPLLPLKLVQEQISKVLLKQFPLPEAGYGFSGGSCFQAAKAHLGFGSVLTLDLREAFSQIKHPDVFVSLRGHESDRKHLLSYNVARMVADFCTVSDVIWSGELQLSWGGFLPQGPSSSPRLFDLAMGSLDHTLRRWGRYRNFRYTRYADNLFFSSKHEEFPPRTRAIILSEVAKKFKYHKLRQINHGGLCGMLGLNLSPDQVCNTRDYKRSFRKAIHHLEYALEHGLPYEEALMKVRGYGGFAVTGSLPQSVLIKLEQLSSQIHLLEWGW